MRRGGSDTPSRSQAHVRQGSSFVSIGPIGELPGKAQALAIEGPPLRRKFNTRRTGIASLSMGNSRGWSGVGWHAYVFVSMSSGQQRPSQTCLRGRKHATRARKNRGFRRSTSRIAGGIGTNHPRSDYNRNFEWPARSAGRPFGFSSHLPRPDPPRTVRPPRRRLDEPTHPRRPGDDRVPGVRPRPHPGLLDARLQPPDDRRPHSPRSTGPAIASTPGPMTTSDARLGFEVEIVDCRRPSGGAGQRRSSDPRRPRNRARSGSPRWPNRRGSTSSTSPA